MKKQFLYITGAALIFAAMLVTVSCKKILDQEPHNSTYTDANFKTETDARTATAGAYSLLRRVMLRNAAWHAYGDLPSGDINADNDGYHYVIRNGDFTGNNVDHGYFNWTNFYQCLQQVNLNILKIPTIPEESFSIEKKAHLVGEAYFLRAYTYFFMSRVWGDVPLKLEPDLDVTKTKNIPRTPADSVIKQCLADVATAESMLDWGYDDENNRAVRANKGSAYALEAHIRAWIHDYAGAEIAANQVITNGGYSLLDADNYAQVFVGKSMEGIFELNINDGQNEGMAMINSDGSYDISAYTLADPYIPGKDVDHTSIQWRINTDYLTPLYSDIDPDADIRVKTFYVDPFQDPKGLTIKYSHIINISKFDVRLSNNIPVFRLADIILLRAEALNALGRDGEALPLLNQVRERAGIDDYDGTGADLKNEIVREELRELFWEGHSYYDLVRTGTLPQFNNRFQATQFQNGSPEGGWLWPIDPTMFKDDPTLVQTPFWRGKL